MTKMLKNKDIILHLMFHIASHSFAHQVNHLLRHDTNIGYQCNSSANTTIQYSTL